ncbi:hypothetical protein CSOJ01_05909 [Colletotrichum sojae]|uniref:Uncharacterized protein n=1 Tax=Colletotrichum sojae TaxID=2175907 RepID=A0A8H6JDI7_9PEZI|nr:hypothetical protein CSOJ01_05909 [Colletotrichum sojae]
MAAVAAQEKEADFNSPAQASKALKAPKLPKASKISKAENVSKTVKSSNTKASAAKSTGKKSSDAKTSDNNSVPLICCVCVNNPRFSDTSHLLTHLGSKGHLANVNKNRILSSADLSALDRINSYDTWYDDYKLAELLAERMMAKDKDKAANKYKRPGQPLAQPPKKKKINPGLARPENDNDAPWTPSRSTKNGASFEHQQAITFFGEGAESPATTPTETSADWAEEDAEAVRLKGVVWPGMNIFDAATPDQRKKRNQRKDASVVQQMELASKSITTTEFVANLAMEIERTRDVYDAPSVENSPMAKKTRRRQKRTRALSEDRDETPEIVVKAELGSDEELLETKARTRSAKAKKRIQARLEASEGKYSPDGFEVDSESVSEKMENFGIIGANDEAKAEVGAEYDDSLGDDQMRSDFHNQNLFNFAEDSDVFRGRERKFHWFPLAVAFTDFYLQSQAGFGVRSRIPLQSMNPNSNLTLASPTPTAKLPPYRMFRGKENNRFLQGQEIGNANYHFDGIGTQMNQTGMSSVNGHGHRSFNFHHQQPQDMVYGGQIFHQHWFPHASGAPNNSLNAVSRNDGQQPLLYDDGMFALAPGAFGGQELDQSQLSLFAHGL